MKKQKIDNVICRGTACRAQCSNGITLVALIITIIILIILAGVSLSIALGENGIFKKSKQAVDTYQASAKREQDELDKLYEELTGLTNGKDEIDGINAKEIAENPNAYYGRVVTNYTCQVVGTHDYNEAVENWKIFLADNNNIYLIADNYVWFQYAPGGLDTTPSERGEYILALDEVREIMLFQQI